MKNQIIYVLIIVGVATSVLSSCHRITNDTYTENYQRITPLS